MNLIEQPVKHVEGTGLSTRRLWDNERVLSERRRIFFGAERR